MSKKIITTFTFEDEDLMVETTLHLLKEKVFEEVEEPKESLPEWVIFSK